MRIALISHSSLYWTKLYASSLLEHGHDVRVMSFSNDALDGVEVEYIGSGTPGRAKGVAYLTRVPQLRRRLRSFDPDVVLATYASSNGLAAALCHPRALVISAHGTDVFGTPGGAWLHGKMMRFACRRADAIHAVSQPIADVLIGYGIPPERFTCFPIGTDLDRYTPGTWPAPEGRSSIVSTRRQEPVYGNDTLIAALARLRDEGLDVTASVIGGGSLLETYRERVSSLGLDQRVELPGQVSAEDVRRALQESDVYVSASRSDGTSSSLLEALACGLFPVVTAIPANEAWVEDGVTGLLFEVGDERGLADALRRAVLDDALRSAAREQNRARVATDGNIAVNMERMEQLLVEVAERRATSGSRTIHASG